MTTRLPAIVWCVLAFVACDGSVVTRPNSPGASSSSTTSLVTSTTVRPALRSEFVAWVAPVDFEELRVGWEAMVLPDRLVRFSTMADCWETNGFEEFAGHVRDTAAVMVPDDEITFPDLARLKESGFSEVPSFWVDQLLIVSNPEILPGALESSLARAPDLGLHSDDAALIRQVGADCYRDGGILTSTMGIPDTEIQWVTVVADLDQEPELAALIGGTVTPCLQGISPEFENENLSSWIGKAIWAPTGSESEDAVEWSMPEEILVEWGRAFAECMAPLEEERRPLRLAAREAWIDEWYDVLIEFQGEADEQLAATP